MAASTSSRALRFILRETLGELLFFPVWWYSVGFVALVRTLWREWQEVAERLALRILLKNMLRPMYADYTRSGRIISFFFRIILVVTRGLVLLVWTAVEVAVIGAWIIVPLLAAALLVRQAVPL